MPFVKNCIWIYSNGPINFGHPLNGYVDVELDFIIIRRKKSFICQPIFIIK